ncbi:MAG: bacterial proteasome activator family protein [Acidimicrobiales bacterium]
MSAAETTPPPDEPSAVSPDEVLPGPGRPSPAGALGTGTGEEGPDERRESIEQPGKVMRIGTMVKQLLDEVRQAPLDEAGRVRLKEIYAQSVRELATGLSPDLSEELDRMALPFDDEVPSEAELRVAQAQLVGWLEGLFHGIQATLVAQQVAARAQLDQMRQRGLPRPGEDSGAAPHPGAYL